MKLGIGIGIGYPQPWLLQGGGPPPFDVLSESLALSPTALYLAGISNQFQDVGATVPATTDNDPVGRVDDSTANALDLLRVTADANRPIWLETGGPNGNSAWDINAGKGFINTFFPSPTSGAIVVLINFDSVNAFAVIVSRMANQVWGDGWGLLIATNGFALAYQGGYAAPTLTCSAAILTGTWYVLSIVTLGDVGASPGVSIRLNGVEIATSTGSAVIDYSDNNFWIGTDTADHLDAKIGAVSVVSVADVAAQEAILMEWAGL